MISKNKILINVAELCEIELTIQMLFQKMT